MFRVQLIVAPITAVIFMILLLFKDTTIVGLNPPNIKIKRKIDRVFSFVYCFISTRLL